MSNHLSTCTFCGVGCGIYLETNNGEITGAYPSMSHPANQGRMCVRGWHVHEVASSPDRLRTPLIRRNGILVPATFTQAYDEIALRLAQIQKQHGPDAIGFLDSARCANEDGYLFQKFARVVVGTNNVDQGTSFYRTTMVKVLRAMLGIAAATNPLKDIFSSKVILLNNLDLGQLLPTFGGSVIRAKLGGAKLIVVGDRHHRIVEHADIFLNIKPGTEDFLYTAMNKIIIDRGLADLTFIGARCAGYEAFLKNTRSVDILMAARQCDVDPALLEQAAIMYAQNSPGMFLCAAGAEEISESALGSMVSLVLLTGNIGKTGAGFMPLSEHNNAQGGCDMGVMPQYLPGYIRVADKSGRAALEKAWGVPIPQTPGLNAAAMFTPPSKLKALWLDRHNPVVSATYCDAGETLRNMEFVVLQNLFMTKTAEYAHVVLPVAAYGEEDVTFTSTERRIQRAVKVIEPIDNLPSAWRQITEVAARMGASWKYASSADVLSEIASVIPAYAAVDADNLSRDYGRQWPCTADKPLGTPLLFADAPRAGEFAFAAVPPLIPGSAPTQDFPFILILGHSQYYWHHNTLVRHSETLKREYGILLTDYPDGFLEINDEDARRLSIRDSQRIRLVSPDGEAHTVARVTSEVRKGVVFMPFFLQDVMRAMNRECSGTQGTAKHVRIEKGV